MAVDQAGEKTTAIVGAIVEARRHADSTERLEDEARVTPNASYSAGQRHIGTSTQQNLEEAVWYLYVQVQLSPVLSKPTE